MATRYPARSATRGVFTVQSARKDKNTLTYSHFVRVGKTGPWRQVDARELAKFAGITLYMPSNAYRDAGPDSYEELLMADVRYIAGMLQHQIDLALYGKFLETGVGAY